MSAKVGTLTELGAMPGDVVQSISGISFGREKLADPKGTGFTFVNEKMESLGCVTRWRMVERRPRTWSELTDAEKGALLLAWHEDNIIEYLDDDGTWKAERPNWMPHTAYRIKPGPVVETMTLGGSYDFDEGWIFGDVISSDTHLITFTTKDGEPDCDSIKMERI